MKLCLCLDVETDRAPLGRAPVVRGSVNSKGVFKISSIRVNYGCAEASGVAFGPASRPRGKRRRRLAEDGVQRACGVVEN